MPPNDTGSLFTPVPNDHAITMLRTIFGPIIDSLLGGGAGTGGAGTAALLTSVIGTFNLAVLVFAIAVGTYLLYSTIFDTAKDGETLGRETDTRYTALRAGIGAFLLLPVAGGFTVAQVLALQVLVWSSAVGDHMWSTAATHLTQVSATYLAEPAGGRDFVTAGKLATAMRTRMLGHLCALHANEIARVTIKHDDVTPQQRLVPILDTNATGGGSRGDTAVQWYFATGPGYSRTSSMCGSVGMYYSSSGSEELGGSVLGGVQKYAHALDVLASEAARSAGEAAFAQLDVAAKSIAQKVFNGDRDTEALKAQVATAIADATQTFQNTVQAQVAGKAQVSQLSQSLLDASTSDGWVFAAVWQRALSSFAFKVADAKDRLAFFVDDGVDPKSASGSIGSRYFSWLGLGNATERTLFESVDRNFGYIGVLDATFTSAKDPVRASGTMAERLTSSNSDASVLAPVQWLYRSMFSWLSIPDTPGTWTDPLLAIQQQGKSFVVVGTTLSAVGAVAPTVGAVTGLVAGPLGGVAANMLGGAISKIASPLGSLFLVLGFVATAFLPFLPFAYYFAGVVAWIVMAIEAMAASSMWCLLALLPARGGDLVGSNRQGMMLMLAAFLRPPLMVLGLIACYVVMAVSVGLLRLVFVVVFLIMAPDWGLSNLIIAAGLLVIYVLLLYSVVINCCSFITGVGDAVMEWINVRASVLGRNTIADDMTGSLNPRGIAAQNLIGVPSRLAQAKPALVNQAITRRVKARFDRS